MNIKETIRAEIERIRSEAVMASFGNDSDWLRSRVATCVDILAILDTMEQPVEGLEEAARHSEILTYPMPEDGDIEKVMKVQEARIFHEIGFKAGAEWGASHAKTPTP